MTGGCLGDVAALLQIEDGLDDANEVLWCLAAGHRCQVLIQPLAHALIEVGGMIVGTGIDQAVFDASDPAIEDVA